ncbi:fasciclin domain-containing protein [Natronoflexus pectinivorans]|nr:fasciclin domain-containing protein [Natronoflexus pectinivorans]
MMRVLFLLRMVVLLAVLVLISSGCEDEDYFERPGWLEKPIYNYLEEQGNFNYYLACVDKSGFTRNLKSSGFYTVFAPNDAAFTEFMSEHGINSIDDISNELAHQIVSYSLVAVGSLSEQIDDYQREVLPEERERNQNIAFKRTTFNYKGVYTYTDYNGVERNVIDVNAVLENPNLGGTFVMNDFNMKSIPFFTERFLNSNGLSVFDYNFFFPETEFSGFNVVDAKVLDHDIVTENGVIHVVDKVILPLPNLEELLMTTDESSDFFNMLENYKVSYFRAPRDFEIQQEQATGQYREIFVKSYGSLHFPPTVENFLRYGGGYRTDNQIDGWTMFAPTNQALQNYLNTEFLGRGYNSLDEMPQFVIDEFLNAHFFRTTVWPSRFDHVQNHFGEPARFDVSTNVVGQAMGSNGLFYVVNKVQETNAFSTVLGDILLSPSYTTMYQALVSTENNFILRNPILHLDVFLINNQHFDNINLNFNVGLNQWEHNNPDWGNMAAFTILDRLVSLHIIFNQDIDLSEGFGLIQTNAGEYIRYLATPAGTRVWGPGQSLSTAARLVLQDGEIANETRNGRTMTLDRPLMFSTRNIGYYLDGNASYRAFFRYLEKSASSLVEGAESPDEFNRMVYNPDNRQIAGIASTTNQTYLIPNDQAIQRAVTDGLLPPIGPADFTQAEQEMVLRFVRYHILNDKIIYSNADYNYEEVFTHYRDSDGETQVYVFSNSNDRIEFTDRRGRFATATATATSTNTNVLANRAVIHLIDDYLDYRPVEND